MVHKLSVVMDISSDIPSAICLSEEQNLTKKALVVLLERLNAEQTLDIDDHFVDIKGIDHITVELL